MGMTAKQAAYHRQIGRWILELDEATFLHLLSGWDCADLRALYQKLLLHYTNEIEKESALTGTPVTDVPFPVPRKKLNAFRDYLLNNLEAYELARDTQHPLVV